MKAKRCLHSVNGWIKKGTYRGQYSSPKQSPDRVKEEEKGRMISQNPKNGSSFFSLVEIGVKNSVLGQQLV